jgi:hypothetical protein
MTNKRKIDSLLLNCGEDTENSNTGDIDFEETLNLYERKRLKVQNSHQPFKPPIQSTINSETFTSTLDRENLSDRQAVRLIGTLARTSGVKIKDLSLSYSTIRRRRIENRATICEKVGIQF